MLSLTTTGKFTPRPPPPPLSSGYQISQQGNEYWNSLATSSDQNNNWKIDYNNNNNNVLMDIGGKCGYDEYTPLPLQTGRLESFSLCLGSDAQSPDDVLHFSPNGDEQEFGGIRWGDTFKHHEQSASHHGLPDKTPSTMRTQKTPPSPSSRPGQQRTGMVRRT